jgi:hypothetical protein
VPIGEIFAFLSGLYFRGKLAYARKFQRPPETVDSGAYVITSDRGLLPVETLVNATDLRRFARTDIDEAVPRYRKALKESASNLRRNCGDSCRFVLLGSIASGKYTGILQEIFKETLFFPKEFVGRGDMSRGGLMLRCVADQQELEYQPLAGAQLHGKRPPRLVPRRLPEELRPVNPRGPLS